MVKLKILSFLLGMLIALQMLPVKQIGQMLGTNQLTEELPHSTTDDGGKIEPSSLLLKAYMPAYGAAGTSITTGTKANAYMHLCEQIPSNHSSDVVSPPPDVLA